MVLVFATKFNIESDSGNFLFRVDIRDHNRPQRGGLFLKFVKK